MDAISALETAHEIKDKVYKVDFQYRELAHCFINSQAKLAKVQEQLRVAAEAIRELENLNDQEGSTLRDVFIHTMDKKRYLQNNVVESERAILKALQQIAALDAPIKEGV